jgi:hypothetical protein
VAAVSPGAGSTIDRSPTAHGDAIVFDRLLSIEMAIKFIHLNKDAVKRNSFLSPAALM